MIRCNPAPGAGEKPIPSQTVVATPGPIFRTKLENNLEHEEALKIMQCNQYLQTMCRNEGQ